LKTPEVRELEVARVDGRGTSRRATDQVAVEAPLEFRIAGQPGAVTMRTPGQDEELVTGFLFAEGVITSAGDVRGWRRLAARVPEEEGNLLEVELRSPLVRKRMPERSLFASSSCGVCGKVSIASLHVHAPVVASDLRVGHAIVTALPGRLRGAQTVFAATGGLHAAGAFSAAGELLALREDVGRHNAVDKLVGWTLAAGVPRSHAILCVSGRLSFEILQKAVVAGFPVVAAVSAPSSAAVDLAERFGVTLCGFVRDGRFNVYSHAERVDS